MEHYRITLNCVKCNGIPGKMGGYNRRGSVTRWFLPGVILHVGCVECRESISLRTPHVNSGNFSIGQKGSLNVRIDSL